jgi:hypothetical protein
LPEITGSRNNNTAILIMSQNKEKWRVSRKQPGPGPPGQG